MNCPLRWTFLGTLHYNSITLGLNMQLLNELLEVLSEASKAQRAWNGKLKKVDALMAWLYDKDILTKAEKAQKDKIFYAYYRFYNDGDIPKALQLKGFHMIKRKTGPKAYDYTRDPSHGTEEALEEYLDKFIKSILTKYLPKIDRTDFRLDKAIKDLETVIKICGQYDPHGILTYWIKTVKMDPESNPKLEALVAKLQKQYDSIKAAADKASPKTSNTTMSYRKEKMKEESTWNDAMEKQWVTLTETMDEITEFLKNIQEGIKKLKQSRLVGAEEKSDEKA